MCLQSVFIRVQNQQNWLSDLFRCVILLFASLTNCLLFVSAGISSQTNTDFYYVAYESETILIELVTAVALSMELALVASILHKYRRLRAFEWFLIGVVMFATLFTASFSVWQTVDKLSPIKAGWMNMLMAQVYLVEGGDFVIEFIGSVFLVSSVVPWTSKLIILPIIVVALMVFLAILVLIYRRVRKFGVFSDEADAEFDPMRAEFEAFRRQQRVARAQTPTYQEEDVEIDRTFPEPGPLIP